MTTEAKGPMTFGLLGLRRLVAESPAFQRRAVVPNQYSAERKIKLFSYGEDPIAIQKFRPFALVTLVDAGEFDQVAGGSQIYLHNGGSLLLVLTDFNRYPHDEGAAALDFAGWVDEVMVDVAGKAGVSDRLSIRSIRVRQAPARPPAKDRPSSGDYWHCAFAVDWKT